MPHPTSRLRPRPIAVVALGALTIAVGILPATAATGRYWTDPASQAAVWVANHPSDPRSDVIRAGVAEVPSAVWFVGDSPDATATRIRTVVGQSAEAGDVPLLVLYNIPGRDCGSYSSGGAADTASGQVVISSADWNSTLPAGGGTTFGAIVAAPGGSTAAPAGSCAAR
jgi:endoglucanase